MIKTVTYRCILWALLCVIGYAFPPLLFAQGTYLVKDIEPGTNSFVPGNFMKAGNSLYFQRRGPGPKEFYKTNGTAAGTQLVRAFTKDVDDHDPFDARNNVDFNGKLVFTKYNDATVNVHELWITDGTSAGTKYISPNVTSTSIYRIEQLTVFNNAVYFVVESLANIRGLYRWDGINNPVKIVMEHASSSGVNHFILVGDGKLFFIDGWRIYDVTNPSTPVVLYDQGLVDSRQTGISNAVFHNGKIVFVEGRPIEGSNMRGLRALDPVTKQYPYIKQELGFGFAFSSKSTPNLVKMGSSVYFHRVRSTGTLMVPNYVFELWKIDPSFQVSVVKEISSPSLPYVRLFLANSSLVVFSLESDGASELWKSNGTAAGTSTLIDRSDKIVVTSDSRSTHINDRRLLLPAYERVDGFPTTIHGTELWTSNFTKEGTRLAVDFNQGSQSGLYDALGFGTLDNNSIFLAAYRRTNTENLHGGELWVSDGSPIAVSGQVPAAPVISSFTPATGPWGTTVTINGTNFTNASAVKFNSTYAVPFTVNSTTKITVNVPQGATTGKIQVITPGGTAVSGSDFTALLPASITSFTPATAAVGTSVNITGTNFTGATQVKFNTGMATTFKVNSATSITATVPAGATTGPIYITTPAGTFESPDNFILAQPPVITSFMPSSGPVNTVVHIQGDNFLGATGVAFNTSTVATFTVHSNTYISATVPAGATTGKISVTTAGGILQSATNYTVTNALPATITNITPASGPAGTLVTITGTNFQASSVVKFNTTNALRYTVTSATTLVAEVPEGATTGKISITTPAGTVQSTGNYTVTTTPAGPPSISSFSPATGIPNATVTITGTNFSKATEVSFNGNPALSFKVNSDASIAVLVPHDAVTGKISVSTLTGNAVSTANFTVTQPVSTLLSGLVKDITSGTSSSLEGSRTYLVPFKNHLYFNPYLSGNTQLWRTDGTVAGTIRVSNKINRGYNSPEYTASGNYLYFFDIATNNQSSFVAMDENMSKRVLSTSSNDVYAIMNHKAFFKKDNQLWVFDESDNTTKMLMQVNPNYIAAYRGLAYFTGYTSAGYGIGRSDGTTTGTFLIGGNGITANTFMFAGNYAYFVSPEPYPYESVLYRTDGTQGGTIKLSGFKGEIGHFADVNGTLFFNGKATGTPSLGFELYKVTGTTVQLVRDINTGIEDGMSKDVSGSIMLKPAVLSNTLYFRGKNSQGTELWKSDGTSTGTVLVKDLNTGSSNSEPAWLKLVGNKLYFSARAGFESGKLHVTDGTEAGTREISYPASDITSIAYFNGNLFFSAIGNGVGRELFVYNLQGITTNVEANVKSKVAVYPNPALNQVHLTLPDHNLSWSVSAVNSLGKEVLKANNIRGNQLTLSIVDLAPGVYILKLENGNDHYVTKFIKQ